MHPTGARGSAPRCGRASRPPPPIRGADYAAVHLVDLPDVHAEAVARVIAAAATTESGLARAYYGDRPGHPVVMARAHWAAVTATARGDEGALPYLREHAGRVRRVDCGDLATGVDRDTR
ncbi:nicotine blue oxidoreductase [Rhodococcus maanshanensis]|uniref:Nicotine blue oxidoreductase n=1 Tax=Rhodococcus maanshanensis TaxID=183556 RepID=A0A1H7WDD8_9NOCA|nr:nicotine blue oxidoreductase [Rhodococcus maanshanensis]